MKKPFSSLIVISTFLTSSFALHAADDFASNIQSDTAYIEANKKFELMLQAAQDVGEKECKSDTIKNEPTRSAWLWLARGKTLSDSEKKRFKVYQDEVDRIKKRMQALLDSPNKSTLQTDGILLQAELLSTEIYFLWGTHGRIDARKNFYGEIKMGPVAAKHEDKLWLDSYDKDLLQGLNQAQGIAKNACDQKEDKKPKGCEDAQSQIQNVIEMIANYKVKFQQNNLPSKKIYDDLVTEEKKIMEAIVAITNGNQDYDWKTPAIKGLEKTIEIRKQVTVYCPESRDSKSQNKAVKIAEIYEDKNKTDDEKKAEMKKVDEAMANSIIGGGLTIDELKKIPTEWNRQNLMFAEGHNREPLLSEITKLIEELIALDQKKYEYIKEKRASVYKLILAMGDMTKSKLTIEGECGADPFPGVSYCPSRVPNPLCDATSEESYKKASYNACVSRVNHQNDMLSQLAKASKDLQNNPNVIGVEPYYIGSVGPIWRAIIRNADGTISYENVIKGPSQYGADYSGATFGGVQSTPPKNNSSTNNSTSSGNSGSTGSSSSSNNNSEPNCKSIGTSVPALNEKDLTKAKENYLSQLKASGSSSVANAAVFCGTNPFTYTRNSSGLIQQCKSTAATVVMTSRLDYEGCTKAVSEFNQLVRSGKLVLPTNDQSTYEKFMNTLVSKESKAPAKVSDVCGENPCKVTVATEDSCTVAENDQAKFKTYNICLSAVNDYNEKLNVEINLSGYIKNHADYVEVTKHPDTGVWVAKMKSKSTGKIYYLPLNFTEGN